jgi:hypothetical protein
MAAGFFWLLLLQESPPEGFRNSKGIQVLYYPGSSGYFHEARYGMTDVRSFLAGYEARMAEGEVLHVGTHPPGLFLLHRGLIELCNSYPALTEFLLATQPDSAVAAGDLIAGQMRGSATPFTEVDRAALWLGALLTQWIGVLSIGPLYLLMRRTHAPRASFFAAALWPLVPALAIFLPKSDALYPFIGLMFLYCWLEGCRRRSLVLCGLAGLVFWCGMVLSLAVLPVGVLALLLCLWETRAAWVAGDRGSWRWLGISVAAGAVLFLGAILAFRLLADVNLLIVWRWNVINHAAFYDQFPRTGWKWLLVNPLELAVAVGLPLFVLAVGGFVGGVREARSARRMWSDPFAGVCVCSAMTIGLLWLSGKNSGEAARLWLFLMPWLIWLAVDLFARCDDGARPKIAWTLLAVQAVVCAATVMRVTGFA